eukprot:COSAG02_NODE_159_length_32891_cov_17.822518_10_plen_57_part_00
MIRYSTHRADYHTILLQILPFVARGYRILDWYARLLYLDLVVPFVVCVMPVALYCS